MKTAKDGSLIATATLSTSAMGPSPLCGGKGYRQGNLGGLCSEQHGVSGAFLEESVIGSQKILVTWRHLVTSRDIFHSGYA